LVASSVFKENPPVDLDVVLLGKLKLPKSPLLVDVSSAGLFSAMLASGENFVVVDKSVFGSANGATEEDFFSFATVLRTF